MNTILTAIITITAISAITILTIVALINGINGAILAGALALIAGLGGYTVGKSIKRK